MDYLENAQCVVSFIGFLFMKGPVCATQLKNAV